MAGKALDKGDFFQWFAVVAAVVYGIYLLASYAGETYVSKDAFQQMNDRVVQIDKKVDVLLERSGQSDRK